jgi:serine/threonine protein kinase
MDPPEAKRPERDAEGSRSGGEPPAKTSSDLHADAAVPTVPDYDLLRRIGGGAYGDVWLARSVATGVMRAAKIVWRQKFDDERPFRREFEGIQRFEQISREHPSQLALFHIGRNDPEGYFYYVMELADGVGSPKSEIRNPKETRNPKSEPVGLREAGSSECDESKLRLLAAELAPFGLRPSDFFRISGFGFRALATSLFHSK